ncbi:MAG: hypothetical protein ACFFE7_12415 [Candidatus Thorarchaeota archaeon]
MKRALLILIISFMLLVIPIDTTSQGFTPVNQRDARPMEEFAVSADPPLMVDTEPYLVLEFSGGDISNRGTIWSQILNSSGMVSRVIDVADVIADSDLLTRVSVILVDASVGSGDGAAVSQTLIDLLIQKDITLILTGRSAWILHRLRGASPPSLTAPATVVLQESAEYAGAVFITSPVPLSVGTSLTTESGLSLPVDQTQTEMSRLVDLTDASSGNLASLRYDSYPLDVFLLSCEDPALLTGTGRGLLQNTIAFSSALRETSTATALADRQDPAGSLLAGGFTYMHEPTIAEAYYAAYSSYSLLSGAAWTTWISQNSALVQSLLETLEVDYGSETGYMTSTSDGVVNCRSTAQGLWLIDTMGLTGSFNVAEIVTYLSSRQDVDGGFENSITSTYHVTEALYQAGQLGSINSANLESWLRSLVIDGGKTSDPDLWGAIGSNPTSLSATNDYALKYLRSLQYIGKAHPDPAKLTSWIVTRTANGDGSYRNSHNPDEELVTGTASALATMQILGTLSVSNRTTGLTWFSNNQLSSGGFGIKSKASDLVAKTRETSRVAACLEELSETGGSLASGIIAYVASISTDIGYETMEVFPSLMWSSWILSASRLSHSSNSIDLNLAAEYLSYFDKLNMYPLWENITAVSPPDYGLNQYRTMSVWTQYFGTSMAESLGVSLSPGVISEVVLFLSQAQWVTGHYRPIYMSGTAHMQYSVAAIETLYLLDELDTIPYRSILESAVLSEYTSGSWDPSGWSLEPYAGNQEAIDFLSTRAALRLGILTASMASEITAAIETRLQYTDLLALSYDVATLSLLNSSAFSTDLESIDRLQVDSALRSHFETGWYNSTSLRQPVITESVFRMVSILGLRCKYIDVPSTIIIASAGATTVPGADLPVSVTITAVSASHSVLVRSFGQWHLYTNVANVDTLMVPVPASVDVLGSADVAIRVIDWGASKTYDLLSVSVQGTIVGFLDLETPTVKMGEGVNGTISWSLVGNVDTGESQVTINLGGLEWYYDKSSLFWFSVPTSGLDAGTYTLTITIEKPYCTQLVLIDEVVIAQPNPTYISASSSLTGAVGESILIDWSLHHAANSSQISGQEVILTIKNSLDATVYTDLDISRIGGSSFTWIPSGRDVHTFTLIFPGNQSLEGNQVSGVITVSEHTAITWSGIGTEFQYTEVSLDILLETTGGEPLTGQIMHVTITAPSSSVVLDSDLVTNSTGYVTFTITLSENGVYLLQADYTGGILLLGTTDTESLISWSSSNLQIGSVGAEVEIGDTCSLWAHLSDSLSNPIMGQSITLRIVLLPSTTILDQTLSTNSTGEVSLVWVANSAGTYRYEAIYAGSLSREVATGQIDFDVLIPVSLTVTVISSSEVGVSNWINVSAVDHLMAPISGLAVTVEVRGPGDELLFTDSGVTTGGALSISWTPSMRGSNTIIVTSAEQLWYQSATDLVPDEVFETPIMTITLPADAVAPTSRPLVVNVIDSNSSPIQGASVYCFITLNGTIIHDAYHATGVDGTVVINLILDTPGILQFYAQLITQGWLLETSAIESTTVYAATTLTITTPGLPIEQGATIGIVITLRDWSGTPMVGSQIEVTITWSNGTILTSMSELTDEYGKHTLAQQFLEVGDFIITATYAGYGLNVSATDAVPQRVYVTPIIEIMHDPSSLVGDSLEIQIGYVDALGNYISGRPITLTIEQSSVIVFETTATSVPGLLSIYWDPSEGGLATISVLHTGDLYVLSNSTSTTISILEYVTGQLWLTPSEIDLFDSTILVYNLTSGLRGGITIHFEVLGMDLVPVWNADITTNSSGMAFVSYTAVESHGILRVNAGPTPDQFLIGGEIQELLVVMTDCVVETSLEPNPPTANSMTNITIWIEDELGAPIDGLTLIVSLFDPYGDQVQLGYFTMSISVSVTQGAAVIEFTPNMVGLYTLVVSSSGASSVHSFSDTTYHTVYSGTQLTTMLSAHDLEVGEEIVVEALLTDHRGNPLVGRNLTLTVDGPGANIIGPVYLVTNATGHIHWGSTLNDEGLWVLDVSFSGLGVYLPIATSDDINVRYATAIVFSLIDTGNIIAGTTPASLSILLRDSGGTPLEGFTVHYEAHHQTLGLIINGNLIQSGTDPMVLNITLDMMGNYTIIVSFAGTTHYHPSNAALQVWVLGTTTVSTDMPSEIDRSIWLPISITIIDEQFSTITLTELGVTVELAGPQGLVNLTEYLTWNEMSLSFVTQGLPVGNYTLSVTVMESETRIGCASMLMFSVVSLTHIEIVDENLTGFISEQHSLSFILKDSLNDTVLDATVWVSIYNPAGREIYGSALTDRTAVTSTLEGSEVSWNPIFTGEYRIFLLFEGDAFLNSTSLEMLIVIRYPSSLTVDMPDLMTFGELVPVSTTLSGVLGRISGASIIITVTQEGVIELQETLITNSQGVASINLLGLLSGTHIVKVYFAGSATQNQVSVEVSLLVTPVVLLDINPTSNLYVGKHCTINVSVTILGTHPDWNGFLDAWLYYPDGNEVGHWTFEVGVHAIVSIDFDAREVGTYNLNTTISGLPIINNQEYPMVVTIVNETMQLQLDAATTPLLGGFGVLAAIGVVLRRKIRGVVGSLPSEWSD